MHKQMVAASFLALALMTPMIVEAADVGPEKDQPTNDDPTPPDVDPPKDGTSELMTQVGQRWCDEATQHWVTDIGPGGILRRCWRENCCDLLKGRANSPTAVYGNCRLDIAADPKTGTAYKWCEPCSEANNFCGPT